MKYQWTMSTGVKPAMMLNTDMEVIYDIDVDNFGNGTQCHIEASNNITEQCTSINNQTTTSSNDSVIFCPKAPTAKLVEIYAKVNSRDGLIETFQINYIYLHKINYDLLIVEF